GHSERNASKYGYGSSSSDSSLKKSIVVQSLTGLSLLCDRSALLSTCLAPGCQCGKVVVMATASLRIGCEDLKTRAKLLDADEKLLLEEGYAAVTSRRVAAKAGLKPQLVHYYFRTMDDLFIEVFR